MAENRTFQALLKSTIFQFDSTEELSYASNAAETQSTVLEIKNESGK